MYRAPLLSSFIDTQIAVLSEPDTVTSPKGQRIATPQQRGPASSEEASTDVSKEEKGLSALQEIRSALPPFGDLAIEEVLRARYMFA